MGIFDAFVDDPRVRLVGVEAGGRGIAPGRSRGAICGRPARACCTARAASCCRTTHGNILPTHSVSAGLDYPSVGPEHAWLAARGRTRVRVDRRRGRARRLRVAGAHGGHSAGARVVARGRVGAAARCRSLPAGTIVLVNLSGRGDKDVETVRQICSSSATPAAADREPARRDVRSRCAPTSRRASSPTSRPAIRTSRDRRDVLRGARARRRRRHRGRRAVLGSDRRRSGDSARVRARARGRRRLSTRRSISSASVRARRRGADRAVHVRQSGPPDGRRRVRRARGRRPASTACCCSICRSRNPTTMQRAARRARHRSDLSGQPDDDRRAAAEAARLGRGFLYAISRLGVTGARDDGRRQRARRSSSASARSTTLPIALGFGISRPEHVARSRRTPTRPSSAARIVQVIAEAAAAGGRPGGGRRVVRALAEGTVSVDDIERSARAHRRDRSTARRAAERARRVRAGEIGRLKELKRACRSISRRARPKCWRTCARRTRGRSTTSAMTRLFERIIDEARRLERLRGRSERRARSSGRDAGVNGSDA